MIKQDYKYVILGGGTSNFVPTTIISCQSKKSSYWFDVDKNRLKWGYKKAMEPMLAPTILSTWSK